MTQINKWFVTVNLTFQSLYLKCKLHFLNQSSMSHFLRKRNAFASEMPGLFATCICLRLSRAIYIIHFICARVMLCNSRKYFDMTVLWVYKRTLSLFCHTLPFFKVISIKFCIHLSKLCSKCNIIIKHSYFCLINCSYTSVVFENWKIQQLKNWFMLT